jgi:hypothetical protein
MYTSRHTTEQVYRSYDRCRKEKFERRETMEEEHQASATNRRDEEERQKEQVLYLQRWCR